MKRDHMEGNLAWKMCLFNLLLRLKLQILYLGLQIFAYFIYVGDNANIQIFFCFLPYPPTHCLKLKVFLFPPCWFFFSFQDSHFKKKARCKNPECYANYNVFLNTRLELLHTLCRVQALFTCLQMALLKKDGFCYSHHTLYFFWCLRKGRNYCFLLLVALLCSFLLLFVWGCCFWSKVDKAMS